MWISFTHWGKVVILLKSHKCKNVINSYKQSQKGFIKQLCEFPTVFHSCGKLVCKHCGFHVDKSVVFIIFPTV